MLVELSIRDLALLEELEVSLGAGLNVITGETGAGKSLLVGALELLCGELPRGGAGQWVRRGAETARVDGRFRLGKGALERVRACLRDELPSIAEEWEEHAAEEPELILGRSLSRGGRTRAYVDQRPVALKSLRRLAPLVLEIHGQNDHQRLLLPAEQQALLDAYGGLEPSVHAYAELRAEWLALRQEGEELDARREEREQRIDYLRFQRDELERGALAPGEHGRLSEERELLRGAADLGAEVGRWIHELAEADDSALDRVRAAGRSLERWRERLGRLAGPLEDLTRAEVHLEEVTTALRSLQDDVSENPARLEVVEERLAELERLEGKYRTDEAGLVRLADAVRAELAELERSEEARAALDARIDGAFERLDGSARSLSAARAALAPDLSRAVGRTLRALGLPRARFAVRFVPRPEDGDGNPYGPAGLEDVEFLLAANPGEEELPLRRVVSGGEAARIMLALRTVLRAGSHGRTLVFDEIDAGVGGRLGPTVAVHLKELAGRDQVLCVTHLPAIAARADVHLSTTKEVRRGRTRTLVAPLGGEARIREIADMIAGGAAHETARAEARRLLRGTRA